MILKEKEEMFIMLVTYSHLPFRASTILAIARISAIIARAIEGVSKCFNA